MRTFWLCSRSLIMLKDHRLTEIFFKALQENSNLASFEDWHRAGDFACEMRFFPHALACYQRAREINQNEITLRKISDLIDKITNVLEFVPSQIKPLIEEIRLSNPLDPAKWLHITNQILKDLSKELEKGKITSNPELLSASRFALAFSAYCSARSGADIEPINLVLKDLLNKVDVNKFQIQKLKLSELCNKDQIKIVVLGDQNSLGLQSDFEIKFSETYHYTWSKESKLNIALANNSVSGSGVLDLALYLGRDAIYYKPDFAFINFGTNDIWLNKSINYAYEALLEESIRILQQNQIRVVLFTPNPHIPNLYPKSERPNTLSDEEVDIKTLQESSKRVAMRSNCILVDSYSKFPTNKQELSKLFSNGYNILNSDGHKLIKQALSETIQA